LGSLLIRYFVSQNIPQPVLERGAKSRLLRKVWYIGKGLSFNAAFVLKDHTRHEESKTDSGYINNLYIKMQTEVSLVGEFAQSAECHRKGGLSLSVIFFALEE